MSRTRVLYEHPLAYAASPVSITYRGRLGEHDLVYFANLFPGLPNTGITGALPSANSRLILTLGAPPSKGYGNGGVVVVCQLADDDLCAGPGYEHNAYTALRVAAAAAALAAVVCAALCLRCCWRRLFRRRREKRD